MLKTSAILAIGFAIFLAVGEAVRNWGDWQWWPFWAIDYLAAALLGIGGFRALTRREKTVLCGAWGLTTGMFYMSFFNHVEWLRAGKDQSYAGGAISESVLTSIIGAMLAIAAFGFVAALSAKTDKND